jgi:acyl-CoA thioester hydrolase
MKHDTFVTVRFHETDALGHVNNTNYFVYLEDARIQLFKDLGFLNDAANWSFVLASAKCDYLTPAYFGQTLKIETNVSRIGTKSFQLIHRILDAKTNAIIAFGEVTIVFYNAKTQKSEALPDFMRETLAFYLLQDESMMSEYRQGVD